MMTSNDGLAGGLNGTSGPIVPVTIEPAEPKADALDVGNTSKVEGPTTLVRRARVLKEEGKLEEALALMENAIDLETPPSPKRIAERDELKKLVLEQQLLTGKRKLLIKRESAPELFGHLETIGVTWCNHVDSKNTDVQNVTAYHLAFFQMLTGSWEKFRERCKKAQQIPDGNAFPGETEEEVSEFKNLFRLLKRYDNATDRSVIKECEKQLKKVGLVKLQKLVMAECPGSRLAECQLAWVDDAITKRFVKGLFVKLYKEYPRPCRKVSSAIDAECFLRSEDGIKIFIHWVKLKIMIDFLASSKIHLGIDIDNYKNRSRKFQDDQTAESIKDSLTEALDWLSQKQLLLAPTARESDQEVKEQSDILMGMQKLIQDFRKSLAQD